MNEAGHEWFRLLREHVRGLRRRSPVPRREELSSAGEKQCQIIGGALISWLSRHGPELIAQRQAVRFVALQSQPYVLIITDDPGLVAATQIIGADHPKIEILRVEEHTAMPPMLADEELRYHIEYETYFRQDVEAAKAVPRKAYRLRPSECYRIHTEITITGPQMGVGADHLWKWDGSEATLLQEAFGFWVY